MKSVCVCNLHAKLLLFFDICKCNEKKENVLQTITTMYDNTKKDTLSDVFFVSSQGLEPWTH